MRTPKTLFQNKQGRIRWSDTITLLVIGLILYNFFNPFTEFVDALVKPQTSPQAETNTDMMITIQDIQSSNEEISSIIIIIDSDEINFLDYYDKELNRRTLPQPKKGEMFEAYFTKGKYIFISVGSVESNNNFVDIKELIPAEYHNQTFYLDLNSNPMLYRKQFSTHLALHKPTSSTVFVGDIDNTNSLTTLTI